MEYLLLVYEFFTTKRLRSILVIVVLPIILGLLIKFQLKGSLYYVDSAKDYISSIINVLGVLLGFCISILTVLLSVDNPNISLAKNHETKHKLNGKTLTVFDTIVINLAYLIVIEGILLIANFIYPIFIDIKGETGKLLFTINICITIHIILMLMRCILDFYFIISKK
jgi:hypothetical protein